MCDFVQILQMPHGITLCFKAQTLNPKLNPKLSKATCSPSPTAAKEMGARQQEIAAIEAALADQNKSHWAAGRV